MVLLHLRPEEPEQGIAACQPAPRRQHQIGEERQALGAGDSGAQLVLLFPQIERAKHAEGDHRLSKAR